MGEGKQGAFPGPLVKLGRSRKEITWRKINNGGVDASHLLAFIHT